MAKFLGPRTPVGRSLEPETEEQSTVPGKIISPFEESEVNVLPKKGGGGKLFLFFAGGLALLVVGALLAVLATQYINNPYRTLPPFSVSKYFEDYQSLAGSRFRADFRVEADLGWKDGAGRLMLFSTSDDSRPVAVMIPIAVGTGIYFTKGQTYTAQVEVEEGGLIRADSFQKN